MDNFLVRLLFVPIILGAQQIVHYFLRMMTEEVHSPLQPSSANDQVSDIAPSPSMGFVCPDPIQTQNAQRRIPLLYEIAFANQTSNRSIMK
jgi:hypothetical protein